MGTEIIIEGWALRPIFISRLTCDISGVFLIADDSLLENRIKASAFCNGSLDPEIMTQKYLERSIWFNRLVKDQVTQLGLNSINVSEDMGEGEIADLCMRLLSAG